MIGIHFEELPEAHERHPFRMDVPCFVGFVARRERDGAPAPVPDRVIRWLEAEGWTDPTNAAGRGAPEDLRDVPIPIDSWDAFDALFAWERRPVGSSSGRVTSWLGAAVRAFFYQGGARCYVVRAGDPWPLGDEGDRADELKLLLPGHPTGVAPSPRIQAEWRGAAHIYGLPEVAYLVMPDLPELFATPAGEPEGIADAEVDLAPEAFIECSEPTEPVDPRGVGTVHYLDAPRCDADGYVAWAKAVAFALSMIREQRPDMHMIASVPLPRRGTEAEGDMLGALAELELLRAPAEEGIGSAFLQLAYPWPATVLASDTPAGLEPPSGLLAGVIARSTMERGGHRSIAGQTLAGVHGFEPELSRREMTVASRRAAAGGDERVLVQRVTILGPSPAGPKAISDVTASADESWRPACVSRIMATLVRACQESGDTIVFEPSGTDLWARARGVVEGLLDQLFDEGALRGASREEAYSVRCDRSTMSQNDLDSGRLRVEVTIRPAAPIEEIVVVLALSGGGRVRATGRGD